MASNVSQRPDECQICLSSYDNNRRPRSTTCGHSFCTECLEDSLKLGLLKCPRCRKEQMALNVQAFPINYDMEAVLSYASLPSEKDQEKCACTSVRGIAKKLEMLKIEQDKEARQLIKTFDALALSMENYVNSLDTTYFNTIRIISAFKFCALASGESKTAIKKEIERATKLNSSFLSKKENLEDQLEIAKTLHGVEDMMNYIDGTDRCIGELEEAVRLQEEAVAQTKELFQLAKEKDDATYSALAKLYTNEKADPLLSSSLNGSISEYLDMLHGNKLTVQDLKKNDQRTRKLIEAGKVYAIGEVEKGVAHSARIDILDGKVMMYAFKKEAVPRGAHTLPYEEVKSLLDQESTLVFLYISWGSGTADGFVFIRITGSTPYGRQFVQLCSGEKGVSYRTSHSYKVFRGVGKSLYCGKFESIGEARAATLTEGLKAGEEYFWPCAAGSVAGGEGPEFIIISRGWTLLPYWHKTGFGKIESGLDYINHAISECWEDLENIKVADCGVVLNLGA